MAKNEKDYIDEIEGDSAEYLLNMATPGVWPTQLEVRAACECYKVNLSVQIRDSPNQTLLVDKSFPTIHLIWHESVDHYNSIRKIDDPGIHPVTANQISLDQQTVTYLQKDGDKVIPFFGE